MNDIERLVVEAAITRVLTDYCRFVDFGEAPRIAELFTDDGVWTSDEVTMNGRAEILAGFGRRAGVTRRSSRHVITNISIDVLGPDEAVGLCYLINFRHDAEGEALRPAPVDVPKYVGEYHDRFVRTDDGWRIQRRQFDLAFVRPPKH